MNIEEIYGHFLKSSGICTDTRKITPNCLFVALKGAKFDGNTFASEAIQQGAYKALIDDPTYENSTGTTLLCENSLETLQRLATHHRKALRLPIIALTGSNGKTTTKELIHAVLAQQYKVSATIGNLNNHIGVPLTLLNMHQETEIGIVEMGANHHGEIAALCEIALPDYGYITNFGKAHLEGFGSLEGVVKAKTELYRHLKERGKPVFVNTADAKQIENTKDMEIIPIPKKGIDAYMSSSSEDNTIGIQYDKIEIRSRLVGDYNYHNLLAALTIGTHFSITPANAKRAIESYVPSNNRSQVIEKNSNMIIMDAYNANPTSMQAAIQNFERAKGDQKYLFLGDMFELGKDAATEHQQITDYLSKHSIGTTYIIGENFYKTKSDAAHIHQYRSFQELADALKNISLSNSLILIKGSRGMALERIVPLL